MKEFNKEEYNKMCGEFLNLKYNEYYTNPFDSSNVLPLEDLEFDSDWNWIMDVVGKIENEVKLRTKTSQGLTWHYMRIQTIDNSSKFIGTGSTKKEAVVAAIWEFFNWYEESLNQQ